MSFLSGSLELFHPGSGSPGGGDKHVPPEKKHPGKQVRSWFGVGLHREHGGASFLDGNLSRSHVSEISSSPFDASRQGPKQ